MGRAVRGGGSGGTCSRCRAVCVAGGLVQNCPHACKFCGDRSDAGCTFPFTADGEKQSRCVFDQEEGLEWCRGSAISPVTQEPLWKVHF